jgi:hypothetical protein
METSHAITAVGSRQFSYALCLFFGKYSFHEHKIFQKLRPMIIGRCRPSCGYRTIYWCKLRRESKQSMFGGIDGRVKRTQAQGTGLRKARFAMVVALPGREECWKEHGLFSYVWDQYASLFGKRENVGECLTTSISTRRERVYE